MVVLVRCRRRPKCRGQPRDRGGPAERSNRSSGRSSNQGLRIRQGSRPGRSNNCLAQLRRCLSRPCVSTERAGLAAIAMVVLVRCRRRPKCRGQPRDRGGPAERSNRSSGRSSNQGLRIRQGSRPGRSNNCLAQLRRCLSRPCVSTERAGLATIAMVVLVRCGRRAKRRSRGGHF